MRTLISLMRFLGADTPDIGATLRAPDSKTQALCDTSKLLEETLSDGLVTAR